MHHTVELDDAARDVCPEDGGQSLRQHTRTVHYRSAINFSAPNFAALVGVKA